MIKWIKINILNYCERCLKNKSIMMLKTISMTTYDEHMKKTCKSCLEKIYGKGSELSIELCNISRKKNESK